MMPLLLAMLTLCPQHDSVDTLILRGTINRSYAIVEVDTCRDAVRLADPVRIHNGQRAVLYQTLGAFRQPVWTTVDTTFDGWVYFATSITAPFDVEKGVQLVTVPSARNVIVDSSAFCAPWDGLRGGVIAIEATDTLIVKNVINASARGFRGGLPGAARADGAADDSLGQLFLNQCGEGVERLAARRRTDKAVVTQGGGRGGARNGGGGGGGGATMGAQGGMQCSEFHGVYSGGVGGQRVALDDSAVEVVFGGGGGAGHQNDHANSRGGVGGGVILIRAHTIRVDSSAALVSIGEDAPNVFNDGAGGGGAGGTIVIDAVDIQPAIVADVRGGKGGKASGRFCTYGSGGDGSYGRVVVTNTSILPSMNTDVSEVSVRSYPKELNQSSPRRFPMATENPIHPGGVAQIVIGTDTIVSQTLHRNTWITFNIVSADGCAYTDSIFIRVLSRRPTISLTVNDASGRPGDYASIVVSARTDDPVSTPIRIKGVLSSRLSVLVPGTSQYTRTQRTSNVPFEFLLKPQEAASLNTIAVQTLTYRCVLGDVDTTSLILDSVFAIGADAVVERTGVFRLEGVCRAGGSLRLFDPWGDIIGVHHMDEKTLRVTTPATVLGVFDMLGRRLDALTLQDGSSVVLTFATPPAREIYLQLMSRGTLRSMVLWLR